jgi:hypothetical protein
VEQRREWKMICRCAHVNITAHVKENKKEGKKEINAKYLNLKKKRKKGNRDRRSERRKKLTNSTGCRTQQ